MAHEVVLASPEKSKYFIGLSPAQFWALYDFLGPVNFNLTYQNELKKFWKKVKPLNKFSTFYYSVEVETWV